MPCTGGVALMKRVATSSSKHRRRGTEPEPVLIHRPRGVIAFLESTRDVVTFSLWLGHLCALLLPCSPFASCKSLPLSLRISPSISSQSPPLPPLISPLWSSRHAPSLCHTHLWADHRTICTTKNHPRSLCLPMHSQRAPLPREGLLTRTHNVVLNVLALLIRVTRPRHRPPHTHASRRSLPLRLPRVHRRATDHPRPHHLPLPPAVDHVLLLSFLLQTSPSPASVTLTRTLCSMIPSLAVKRSSLGS